MKFPQINLHVISTTSIILSVCMIGACFSTPEKKTESAQELIKEGIEGIKTNARLQARTAFQQVLDEFPDSKERKQALLLLARTYYTDKEFEEAKFYFQKFIELYPVHPQVDRAYFFKAMSDYKMIDLVSRDQTPTQEALDGFKQLINRFPKSQFLEDAKKKLQKCKLKLAESVLKIGKFYYRTGAYQSAINRLKSLMIDHPQQKILEEAIFLIAESYYHEQNFDEALVSYKKLLKKYPKSQFKLQAINRLKNLRRQSTL